MHFTSLPATLKTYDDILIYTKRREINENFRRKKVIINYVSKTDKTDSKVIFNGTYGELRQNTRRKF